MSDLGELLQPSAIAIYGASESAGSVAGRAIRNLRDNGFAGRIIPVTPKYPDVYGLATVPSLAQAGEQVQCAIVGLSSTRVAAALRDCASAGVMLAVVPAAGFAEENEMARQDELSDIARQTGMRIIGPNCLGFLNTHAQVAATTTGALQGRRPIPGGIALISQSGGLAFASIFARATDAGVGFSFVVSTGNEADLNALDFVEAAIEDPNTTTIAVLIEQLRGATRFMKLAEHARSMSKQIIALKIGRTTTGARAAAAHTGSIAGTDLVYEEAFRCADVIRVHDIDDLWKLALLCSRGRPRGGRQVAVVTRSGGISGLLGDHLELSGLSISPYGAKTAAALTDVLPGYVTPNNPLDLTGRVIPGQTEAELTASIVGVLGGADEVDHVVLCMSAASSNDDWRVLGDALATTDKTVVALAYASGTGALQRALAPIRVPLFDTPTSLAAALSRLAGGARAHPDRGQGTRPKTVGARALPAADCSAMLAVHGVPMAAGLSVASAAEAVQAAVRLGYPVVVKPAAGIVHKSDVGAVWTDLRTKTAVRAAVQDLRTRLAVEAFLVQRQVAIGYELIVGATLDPDFGVTVILGWGGIHAEILPGAVPWLAEFEPLDVGGMVAELPGSAILRGHRNQPVLDLAALERILRAVATVATDLGASLLGIDLNPVAWDKDSQEITVLDARILLAS
jgi:acetate---CoA ligase (ADP-forming)